MALDDYFSGLGGRGMTYSPQPDPLVPKGLLIAFLMLFLFAILIVVFQIVTPLFTAFSNINADGFSLIPVLQGMELYADYFLSFGFLGGLAWMLMDDHRNPSTGRAIKYLGFAILLGWFYTIGLQFLNPILPLYQGELAIFYSVIASGFFVFSIFLALSIGIWLNLRDLYGHYYPN